MADAPAVMVVSVLAMGFNIPHNQPEEAKVRAQMRWMMWCDDLCENFPPSLDLPVAGLLFPDPPSCLIHSHQAGC